MDTVSLKGIEWITLNDAVDAWLHIFMSPSEFDALMTGRMPAIPDDAAEELNEAFTNGSAAGKIQWIGVKQTVASQEPQTAPEPIPTEYFRMLRTMRPHLGMIEATSDKHTMRQHLVVGKRSERNPNWLEVFARARPFMAWLQNWTAEFFTSEIKQGRMSVADANAKLSRAGFPPLHMEPDINQVISAITQEAYWTLPMAVAWVASRKMESVAQQHTTLYQAGRWSGDKSKASVGQVWMSREDAPSLVLMLMEGDVLKPGDLHTVRQAKEMVWQALQRGELSAVGTKSNDRVRQIAKLEWAALKLGGTATFADYVAPGNIPREEAMYFDIRFLSEKVREIWPAVENLIAAPEVIKKPKKRSAVAVAYHSIWGEDAVPEGITGLDRNNQIHAKIVELGLTPPINPKALQKAVERHLETLGL